MGKKKREKTSVESDDKSRTRTSKSSTRKESRKEKSRSKHTSTRTKFVGLDSALNDAGVVFDCGRGNQAQDFTKMMELVGDYCGSKFETMGPDVKDCLRELRLKVYLQPIEPTNVDANGNQQPLTFAQQKEYEIHLKTYMYRKMKLEQNLKQLCTIILGQCTDAMKTKLKALQQWTAIEQNHDVLALVKAIKSVIYNFRSEKLPVESLGDAYRKFYLFYQKPHMSVNDYLDRFMDLVEMVEHCHGKLGSDLHYVDEILRRDARALGTATNIQVTEATEKAEQEFLAVQFLVRSDRHRFGKLIEDTQNAYLQGKKSPKNSGYPTTVVEAHALLLNWKHNPHNGSMQDRSAGVAFNQQSHDSDDEDDDSTGAGSDDEDDEDDDGVALAQQEKKRSERKKWKMKCHFCGSKEHTQRDCPKKKKAMELLKQEESRAQNTDTSNSGAAMVLHDGDALADEFDFADFEHMAFVILRNRLEGLSCRQGPRFLRMYWLLIDSQSTDHLICNRALLKNIRPAPKPLKLHCNAGWVILDEIGDLPGVGEVYYDPNGIANILSMAKIAKDFKVTYDSTKGNKFIVSRESSGTYREFKQSPNGLYYHDLRGDLGKDGVAFVNTVDGNKSKYSRRAYLRAVKARKLHNALGRPSIRDYMSYVQNNRIHNCPVTREDIMAAQKIFGPNLGILKGGTTRKRAPQVRFTQNIIPPEIMERHKNVTLAIDIMKINKIPFFMSISIDLKFGTAEFIPSMKADQLLKSIKLIMRIYRTRGLRVTMIKADNQFEVLRGDLATMQSGLNTVSEDEHVPEIERHNRVVKERVRATHNTVPFQYWPARLIIEAVYAAQFWLNVIPPIGNSMKAYSPREIVIGGGAIDFTKHCRLEFGEYVQTHEDHDNTMATRTIGAIALRPNGNLQGGHLFYSLTSGRVINRKEWTALPMPNEVIDQVHRMARRQNATRGLTFTDGNNVPYEDVNDDDDPDYEPDGDADADDSDEEDDTSATSDTSDDTYDQDSDDDGPDDDNDDDDGNFANDNNGGNIAGQVNDDIPEQTAGVNDHPPKTDEIPGVPDTEIPGVPDDHVDDNETAGVHDESVGVNATRQPTYAEMAARGTRNEVVVEDVHEEEDEEDDPPNATNRETIPDEEIEAARAEMEKKYGRRSERYDLRPRKPRSYAHLNALMNDDELIRHVFAQMSAKAGIKAFGQQGVDAIFKEAKQLHDRAVGQPVHPEDMTREELAKALNYLMFLQKKRTGVVKARGCADGRKQRVYKTKAETASPTVMTESIMISATIDAKERRDVATIDIPGAFMQANIDEILHVLLKGKIVELLVRLDPKKYKPYVRYDKKGVPYMYMLLDKALYGTVQAAMLFWKDLTKNIKRWGFELNPYDPCVANAMINGKQCTILWHVDDMKISHEDKNVVTDIINKIKQQYGKIGTLTETRGKVHPYLGMVLDYTIDGKVIFQMYDFLDKMCKDLPASMQGEAATPAANHLFKVRDDARKLGAADTDFFHTLTAKSLFLSKRARPDIQTAVAFLCTRVKAPDEDDWKKLGRMMKYLQATRRLKLTLEWDGLNIIKWWADAAFATHMDMKGHTGGLMTMGKGAIASMSRKQKLNTRSSTETELVGADDIMPMLIWSVNFLRAQGYKVKMANLYQDNMSAMLLEKNGRASSSRRTRHLNLRFFFITDQIKKGLLGVEYCPTGDMVADYYSKPLQGSGFKKFRNTILNIQE